MEILSKVSILSGLIYFFAVYLLICFITLRPSRKEEFESYAQIPLNKEKNHD